MSWRRFRHHRLHRSRRLDGREPAAFFERVIESFGWDRVVWGSDWPVCNLGGGLAQWVAATHALLAGASDSERTKLLSGNAKRVWELA
jgi:predicted TIM-barrel fold metal-dependent hydrolase